MKSCDDLMTGFNKTSDLLADKRLELLSSGPKITRPRKGKRAKCISIAISTAAIH